MNKIDRAVPKNRCLVYAATIGIAAAGFVLGPDTAVAAEWSLAPLLRASYDFDDNATLSNDDTMVTEIHGGIYDAATTLAYATERTTFDATPLLRWRRYSDSIFNSSDHFVTLNFQHEGLKSNFRIRGEYANESTRTAERAKAEAAINDPDDIPDDDSGASSDFGDRQRFQIAPQWRYNLTEKTAVGVKVMYRDVDYETQSLNFVPYKNTRLDLTLDRALSPRTRGHITASARRFDRNIDITSVSRDVDTYGFNVGFDQQWTQKTRFRAEVGMEESRPDVGTSESDLVGNIYLIRNLETVRMLAQYKRSLSASGTGQLNPRDSINLSLDKQFTERVNGGLALRAYRTNKLENDPANAEERDYGQFGAQLTLALTRVFSLQTDYRYTYIDRSSVIGGAANSNEFVISIIYQPTPITTSR